MSENDFTTFSKFESASCSNPNESSNTICFSFDGWKSELNKLEHSHSCTSFYLKNLVSMCQSGSEEYERLKSCLLKEKEKSDFLTTHLEFVKAQYQMEKKKCYELQKYIKETEPDLGTVPDSLLNEDLFTLINQNPKERNDIPSSSSKTNTTESTPVSAYFPCEDSCTSVIEEKANSSATNNENSLFSDDVSYSSGKENENNIHFSNSQSSLATSFPNEVPFPTSTNLSLNRLDTEVKWLKTKEIEEAINKLRNQKDVLFKETESILLYKRQLVAEIELLEHQKAILGIPLQKNGKAVNDFSDLRNTIQSELEVLRSNKSSYPSLVHSTHVCNQNGATDISALSRFLSMERQLGTSKPPEATDDLSTSDSSSFSTNPYSFPEATNSLLSPTHPSFASNLRNSVDPYLNDPPTYSKKSKKHSKFQLGFTTVSNALTKFRDKLSPDDNSVVYENIETSNNTRFDKCHRKGSNASNQSKDEEGSCLPIFGNEYKPHAFAITRLPAILPCSVCQTNIHERHSKELKCLHCGIAVHARCAAFLEESCTSTTLSNVSSFSSLLSYPNSISKSKTCSHSIPSSISFKLSTSSPFYSSNLSTASTSPPYSNLSVPEASKMFGVDLITQVAQEGRTVPLILEFCLSTVEAFGGLKLEGIYRKSGPAQCIRSLVQAFDQGVIPDLRASAIFNASLQQDPPSKSSTSPSLVPIVDLCVTTSVLKQYLRELPNPLITFAIYPIVCNAIHKHVSKVKEALQALPKPHWDTLLYLFNHLKLVVDHSSENRMSSRNLGVVFGPTLMRHASHNDVYDMAGIQVVEYLLDHHREIFVPTDIFTHPPLYRGPSLPNIHPVYPNSFSFDFHNEKNANKKHRRLSVVF